MSELDERIGRFVGYLRSLATPGNENRGALADLRSGLGRQPGEAPRMHRHVVPFLGDRRSASDRWFYVAGAIFGANPDHQQGSSPGESFRKLRQNGSESIEGRFVAILGSHPDDLIKHLAHVTGLLKSSGVGIDFYRLVWDLVKWESPDHEVQDRWARDFYYRP